MPLHTQAAVQSTGAPISPHSFLARLPRETQDRLVSAGNRIDLNKEERIVDAGARPTWSYFPHGGLVSLQTMTQDGDSVEVAMVGSEGVIGLPIAETPSTSPHTAVVLLPSQALRIRCEILHKEFQRDAAFHRSLIAYWHDLTMLIAQRSMCHRFHTARRRLASWLLAASDRTHNPSIQMTQERLGDALGVKRTGVTAASIALQDAGAIRARHGRITIADRRQLEALACECYKSATTLR